MSSPHASAERAKTLRSRVTNGKDLLANVDGPTADARRYRDLCVSLADDLGGTADLTEAQRAMVRQAAAMIVQSERLQSAVLRGELVHGEQLTRLANAATRILSNSHTHSVISIDDLVVDLDTKTAKLDGEHLHLTGKEYDILELLALRKGACVTKDMILNHLYGGRDEPEVKIIDVYIGKLRNKLAGANRPLIETVWGLGYMMRSITAAALAA